MASSKKLAEDLKRLSPQSDEFYSTTASYFRKRALSHRNYGRFFLFLACVSLALLVIHWNRRLLAMSVVPGYFLFVALGLITINGSRRMFGILKSADGNLTPGHRLKHLREAALCFAGDPVSALVLKVTKPDEAAT